MAYLNEDGLARYDGFIKNWVTFKSGTIDGVDALLNWQRTATASTVSFYPLPAAPLDPIVTFAFTEADPTEGEKSPTNPSIITGVNTITVTRCETEGVDSMDYIVNLGNTYYGGFVDVSAGTMTVTWDGYIVNGQEDWDKHEQSNNYCSGFYCNDLLPSIASLDNNNETRLVSHFNSFSFALDVNTFFIGGGSNGKCVVLKYSTESFPDLNTFTSWLAQQYANGTPVTIAYKLATPYTVSLTPTQIYSLSQVDLYTPRRNTVYSNQVSVQVGYPKSPIQTESELRQMLNT